MDRSRQDASANDASGIDGLTCTPNGSRRVANGAWDLSAADAEASEQTQWLSRTIETEIIPRLMLAHRRGQADLETLLTPASRPSTQQVDEFALLTLGSQLQPLLEYVRNARASGLALETLYLELLAPAARRLGALWEADQLSFTEVTLGLWRLQQVMHELGAAFQYTAQPPGQTTRRAILAPVPGSQHTLGLFMVSEFFRRAGWDVWGDATVTAPQIVAAARSEWFDIVGLSVGSEAHFAALASVILDVRKASRNRSLVVIIGGPIVASTPGLVARVGADATAEDAPQAVMQAESLLAERSAAP
jgi:methanogenic corrinoid protein MtbC1